MSLLKSYVYVETVRGFTCLGDRMSLCGHCESAVIARTRYGWVMFRECGELLYGMKFPIELQGAVLIICV